MSVSLFRKTEINSLMKTYGNNEDEQRAIWYAYVSNVVAYNLQYQENAEIDFTAEKYENIDEHTLFALHYNMFTNNGNHFMQEKWFNIFMSIYNRVRDLNHSDQVFLATKHNVKVNGELEWKS